MQTEVVILTEAGKEFGYGHLFRCLAIAQGFKEKNIESVFYLKGDSVPGDILKGFTWHNIDWIKSNVVITDRIVILDSYYVELEFCRKVYNQAAAVLFIDDFYRIPYPGGFVLNSVIGVDDISYPEENNATYLFGSKYHPLRKEFWDVPEKVIKENLEKILITFGGTDLTNETPRILSYLTQKYPGLEKHVIIGNGFSNVNEIKTVADKKTTLILKADAETMKREMLECDIAISAAGQTIFELARIGVPSLIKQIIFNQENNVQFMIKEDCILILNEIYDIDQLLGCGIKQREQLSTKMKRLIDGRGVRNIINHLIKTDGAI